MLAITLNREFAHPTFVSCKIGKHSLSDLKEHMVTFGKHYILDTLIPHKVDYLKQAGSFYRWKEHGYYDFTEVVRQIGIQATTKEERKWGEDLKALQVQLYSFSRNEFESLQGDAQDKYVMDFARGCVVLLDALVIDFINKNDPRCPVCPNAWKDATWDLWWKGLDMRRYWTKLSNLRYPDQTPDLYNETIPGPVLLTGDPLFGDWYYKD